MQRKKLVVAALVAAGALVGTECAARRLFLPPEFVQGLLYDPVLGFRSKPNVRLQTHDEAGPMTWFTNSRGFIGPELPDAALPKEERRLLFLGDSFLHVWNVRLENAMTEVAAGVLTRAGTPTIAWNVSCNGWGTVQERIALREYGPRVRPDVVVLSLFPSNDLANNEIELADRTYISTGDFLHPYLVLDPASGALELRWSQPVRAFLRRCSRLFGVLEQRLQVLAKSRKIDWLLYGGEGRTNLADRLRRGLSPEESLEFLRSQAADHPWEKAWATTEALLVDTRRAVEELGARFLVVVIPHRYQVQSDAPKFALDHLVRRIDPRGLDAEHDWNRPETRLARLAAEEGIEMVMLLERLRARARAGENTYQPDGHLNTLGHRVAGEAIAERLLANAPVADPVPTGAPVDVLGPPMTRIDWRAEDEERPLGGGWHSWSASWFECGAGRASAGYSQVVLSPAPGALVLRGCRPAAGGLPARVSVEVGRRWNAEVTLEQPGPFEVRVPHAQPGEERVLIEINITPTFRGGGTDTRRFGVIVRELGFEASAESPPPGEGAARRGRRKDR